MMTRRSAGVWLAGWMLCLLVASSRGQRRKRRANPYWCLPLPPSPTWSMSWTGVHGQTRVPVKASYAASSVLAKQIEAGAPADVFFSADTDWVDYLDQRKLLKPGTRRDVVANRLVLIAPWTATCRSRSLPISIWPGRWGTGKLATGDPDSVPVGKYAQAALEKLGAWDAVSSHIVRAENVRVGAGFRRPGRSGARHRLCDRRQGRESGQSARCVSREHASSHHVPDCADRGCERGCGQVQRVRHERRRLRRSSASTGSNRCIERLTVGLPSLHFFSPPAQGCCLTLPHCRLRWCIA